MRLRRYPAVAVARNKRDIFDSFYDELERMGEYCAFHIGQLRAGMSAPEWTKFRHQEYDGASALAHILRTKANTEIDIETSPNPPSSWTLFVAFLRLMLLNRSHGRIPPLLSIRQPNRGRNLRARQMLECLEVLPRVLRVP